MTTRRFGPVDLERMQVRGRLSSGRCVQAVLDVRELAVGLIRGRLRQQYPDLSPRALNSKALEETACAQRASPGSWPFPRYPANIGSHGRPLRDHRSPQATVHGITWTTCNTDSAVGLREELVELKASLIEGGITQASSAVDGTGMSVALIEPE